MSVAYAAINRFNSSKLTEFFLALWYDREFAHHLNETALMPFKADTT